MFSPRSRERFLFCLVDGDFWKRPGFIIYQTPSCLFHQRTPVDVSGYKKTSAPAFRPGREAGGPRLLGQGLQPGGGSETGVGTDPKTPRHRGGSTSHPVQLRLGRVFFPGGFGDRTAQLEDLQLHLPSKWVTCWCIYIYIYTHFSLF